MANHRPFDNLWTSQGKFHAECLAPWELRSERLQKITPLMLKYHESIADAKFDFIGQIVITLKDSVWGGGEEAIMETFCKRLKILNSPTALWAKGYIFVSEEREVVCV